MVPLLSIKQFFNDLRRQKLRSMLTMFGVFLVALYWVWSDLISVVSYLDNITLYEYTTGSGETLTTAAISLNNLLGALLIVAITVALARNLPGLLEVMVLSKLRLAQGSAYATTTLLSYALAGFASGLARSRRPWSRAVRHSLPLRAIVARPYIGSAVDYRNGHV